MITVTSPAIFPSPALHLRPPGPLVAGHRTNLANVLHKPGEARFRFGVRHRGNLIFRHWMDDPEDAASFWREIIENRCPSWLPHPRDYPDALYAVDSVTFLTTPTGGTTYIKPGDWNNFANYIEGIGSGLSASGLYDLGRGAGAYARANNVTLTGNGSYAVPAGGGGGAAWFNDASSVTKMSAAGASHPWFGGTAASSTGDVKYSGGDGANGAGNAGGGSGGPSGAGSAASGTTGGAANNGTVAGGTNGSPGGNGAEWDATHGCGGGGGGNGGAGGRYGGGGGHSTGTGYQGIVIVTYTPLPFVNAGKLLF